MPDWAVFHSFWTEQKTLSRYRRVWRRELVKHTLVNIRNTDICSQSANIHSWTRNTQSSRFSAHSQPTPTLAHPTPTQPRRQHRHTVTSTSAHCGTTTCQPEHTSCRLVSLSTNHAAGLHAAVCVLYLRSGANVDVKSQPSQHPLVLPLGSTLIGLHIHHARQA